MKLAGRIAIVTGAASGIGRAVAGALAGEGAEVVVADVDVAGGEQVVGDIRQSGGSAEYRHLDVTREEDVKAVFDGIGQRYGRLDILVANAGINPPAASSESLTAALWHRTMDVNALGVFLSVRAAIPHLRKSGVASVVTLGSVSGLIGWGGSAAYVASKGAVVSMTRYLAAELAPGIRVNTICPGSVLTPMVESQLGEAEEREANLAKTAGIHLLGRVGKPAEIARGVLYLASDDSSFVTGSSLVVDGGLTAV